MNGNINPIGVFDSGVGGLTTVQELQKILPGEDIIYFGDTGRVPYGTRGRETIRRYAKEIVQFLTSMNVKAIVAACGTVSSNFFLEDVREMGVNLPYYTIVKPATRAACEQSVSGKIGVIATPATIRSAAYDSAVREIRPDAGVVSAACPLLVPLVENGMIEQDNPITRLTLEMYLEPVVSQGIDTLILGCTHYPLLSPLIDDILEHKVKLIDAGACAAREVRSELEATGLLSPNAQGKTSYYVTDAVESFVQVARHFLSEDISADTQHIDLHSLEK